MQIKPGIERVQACILANILRSRYVARTPPLEARSPGRRSNVENAYVTCWSLISNAHTPRKLGFALCCYSNATSAPIANPPNSAQLGGSFYHAPKLHPGSCSSVGVRPRTDRHTDTQTRVTHAKNKNFMHPNFKPDIIRPHRRIS